MITPPHEPGRNDRRSPPFGALAAVAAILAVGCGGAEPPSCPTGAVLDVDLTAWTEEIGVAGRARAKGGAIYDPILAKAGLGPLPDVSGDTTTPEESAMNLRGVQVTPLRRGGDEPFDWLVAARFGNAAGAEAVRALLLQPVPGREHTYCPLGDELSRDTEPSEEPCLEPHHGPARALETESLITPNRDALVIHDAGGWCGPGARRGDRLTTSFWGVEDGRLVRYLEAVTFEAWYESPQPPGEIRRAEIDLSDGWPRDITLNETVECPQFAETAPADGDCRPLERTRTYRYTAGRYAAVDKPSPAPSTGGNQETRP